MARHCQAIVEMQRRGAVAFDYGNNLRAMAKLGGFADAFSYPGFVPAFIRDLFCEGKGPFRWVALSGDPEDIYRTDRAVLELFPEDEGLKRWLTEGVKRFRFQGLPAASAGWGTGNGIGRGSGLTRWCGRGNSRLPLSSAGIT